MIDLNCGLGWISVICRLFNARSRSSGCGVLILWAECKGMSVLGPAHKLGAFGWIAYEMRRVYRTLAPQCDFSCETHVIAGHGRSEKTACCWSVNLFVPVLPRSFASRV